MARIGEDDHGQHFEERHIDLSEDDVTFSVDLSEEVIEDDDDHEREDAQQRDEGWEEQGGHAFGDRHREQNEQRNHPDDEWAFEPEVLEAIILDGLLDSLQERTCEEIADDNHI